MFTQSNKKKVPILMYHSISEHAAPKFKPFAVSPTLFAEHMAYLHQYAYSGGRRYWVRFLCADRGGRSYPLFASLTLILSLFVTFWAVATYVSIALLFLVRDF